ncbi:hypothetical protein [Georgenia thermotolerans]|uniref:YrhK domain-containing protein n=1 Tax=Georgenia thermotolerans TaxID=527326 RepID=A0A7J5UMY1_9MICO|nr:hypothetical protein [Georgenia thermotolerans]KAE8763707.1 hypothetical protein GB883_12675 [Georgenia thermotolerans]
MRVRPAALNRAIAWLFIVGAACFALGAMPAYAGAVGTAADSVTFFVGSIFFTSASFAQLLQAQTPAMTDVDLTSEHVARPLRFRAWRPHDPGWLGAVTQFLGTLYFNVSTFASLAHNATVAEEDRRVWRPDFVGSTLFLVASGFAIYAVSARFLGARPALAPRGIAWLNMIGSVFFMASAIASYVLPSTAEDLGPKVSGVGTLLGALCFLAGASLMFTAWRSAVQSRQRADFAGPRTDPG